MKVTNYAVVTKIKDKGALFVEYALVLAFVVFVGVSFIGDKSMVGSINKIFDNVAEVLELSLNNDGKIPAKSYDVKQNTYWSSADLSSKGVFTERNIKNYDWAKTVNSSDLIEVGIGANYSIVLDKTAMLDYLRANGNTDVNDADIDNYLNSVQFGLFSMNENKAPIDAYFVDENGTRFGKKSDSNALSVSQINQGVSLDASAEKEKVYVAYNIIHSQASNTTKYIDYDKALINTGIKITAGK